MEDKHIDLGVIPIGLRDHFASFTTIALKQPKNNNKHVLKRSRYSKCFDESLFLNDIVNSVVFNKIVSYNNVETVWKMWKNEFNRICNKDAPVKSSRVKQTENPWITDNILKLINHREYSLKKALLAVNIMMTSLNIIEQEIMLLLQLERPKRNFTLTNLLLLNLILRNILPDKRTQNVNIDLKASNFNMYFSTFGSRLSKNMAFVNVADTARPVTNHTFKFNYLPTLFIEKSLSSLKSSSSLDVIDMNSILLKVAAKQIAPSLSYLFNLSLSKGMIPEDFKLARVTPIFKGKGDPTIMGNYRPISVISHLAKILEKAVKLQLMNYLTAHNLITEHQMAYIKGRSTDTALSFLTNTWIKNIDNGLYYILVV